MHWLDAVTPTAEKNIVLTAVEGCGGVGGGAGGGGGGGRLIVDSRDGLFSGKQEKNRTSSFCGA